MVIQAAKLIVEVGADVSSLQRGLRTGSDALTKFASNMVRAGTILTGGITAPAVFAAKEIFNVGAALEQSRIAFTTMLGSEQRASGFLNELRDFSKTTPFEFMGLQDSAKRMMAFGFSAEQVLPMLRDIGDAAAGLGIGAAGVDRIVLALGQMQAKTKVSGQEMMQLTEAGIGAWGYLADAMGMSTAEVMKLSEKGLIPADQAIQAILAGMQKNFGGLMAQQANTAAGSLSNLKDELNGLAADVSTNLLPVAKELIASGRESVQAFNALPQSTKDNILKMTELAAAAGPAMIALAGISTALNSLIAVGGTASKVFNGVTIGFQAFRAGMTLTTALGAAGLAPIAITLGAIAVAVGSVAAVWGTWNKQIVETNRKGVDAAKGAWSQFFSDQIQSGKNATQILDEYDSAQARIAKNLKFDILAKGWTNELGKLFVDRSALQAASASELSSAILQSAASYSEYETVMQGAGLASDLLSQREFELSRTQSALRSEVTETSASLAESMALMGTDATEALEKMTSGAQKMMGELDAMIAKQDQLRGTMDAWVSGAASEVQQLLGQRFVESSSVYRDAMGVIDEEMGTNYLEQLKLKDSIKELVGEYANTKNMDKFREGLIKIRDDGLAVMKAELENVIVKVDQLRLKLLALPKEIQIHVGFSEDGIPVNSGSGGGDSDDKPRAHGGPVKRGEVYMVGERGPELFVPNQSGQIIPNDQIGGKVEQKFYAPVTQIFGGGGDDAQLLGSLL